MRHLWRGCITTLGLLMLWQLAVWLFALPPYILPGPLLVIKTWWLAKSLIAQQSLITISETLLGLVIGSLLGCIAALILVLFRPARLWLLPILIISQAIPTFAIAPLLVVWFGYGIGSKVVTAMIMLFFPVTTAFFDGLRRTDKDWLDLAHVMGANSWRCLWHIRLPAALPALGSGLRVAAAIAPIGAIIGEWVGASRGLGFLLLNANARMQIDMMFAVLLSITVFTLVLYYSVDKVLRYTIPWGEIQ
ncbi:MAG: ABC transporter permease [Legionellales bacterium]|nr:ABC transporter permease [Legionellales bacterium]|tara:strand:+ start:44754 stop:45497 length:744 start_codon:yes stop_codon:yes gene_type:complete